MSEQNKIEQRDGKYWIKAGVEVCHRDLPERKMIVDEVLKKTETIVLDGKSEQKIFTLGVDCHWFDENNRYDRGRFLTMELLPFGKKPKNTKDPLSFPKDIPPSAKSSENVL